MGVDPTAPAYVTTRARGSPWRATVAAGLVAAAVTTAVAAAIHAAGVSFEVGDEMIPLAGFAQMTFLGAVIDGGLLAVLNRRHSSAGARLSADGRCAHWALVCAVGHLAR